MRVGTTKPLRAAANKEKRMVSWFPMCRAFVAGLSIGVPSISAQVSMAVALPVPASVGSTSVPAGPLALPQTFIGSGSGYGGGGGSASLTAADSFPGQVAPTAFRLGAGATAGAFASPGWFPTGASATGSASIAATFRFTFSSPTPFADVLRLASSQSVTSYSTSFGTTIELASGSAQTRIDIGADGTFEHTFNPSPMRPDSGPIELPVSFQSTLDVDVVVQLSQTAAANSSLWLGAMASGSANATLSGELNADYFVVQERDTTGAGAQLEFVHGVQGDLDLTIQTDLYSPPPSIGLFAVGVQPVSVPLLPTATQLVSADAIVLGAQASGTLPRLPAGTAFCVQGFGVNAAGNWVSTRSLQVLWL
jgi:hypothetical protein